MRLNGDEEEDRGTENLLRHFLLRRRPEDLAPGGVSLGLLREKTLPP